MSGFEVDDFARLERHDGHQILCRIEAEEDSEGSYGPRVITRCDYGVTIETRGAVLRNWMLGYLANLQLEDIKGQDGQNRIRREIQNHFNDILSPDGTDIVHDVLFEEFQIQ